MIHSIFDMHLGKTFFIGLIACIAATFSCQKTESDNRPLLEQKVSYIMDGSETVLVNDSGCNFSPQINILHLTLVYQDRIELNHGLEFWAQRCDTSIFSLARNYILTTPSLEELAPYLTTREFITDKVESDDLSEFTHHIEICHQGRRYQHVSSLSDSSTEDGNFVRVELRDPSIDCRLIAESTLFVNYRYDGFLYNMADPTDSIWVTFPDAQYYFPF